MKFKNGDTVYIKTEFSEGYEGVGVWLYNRQGKQDITYAKFYTKEEMLAELTKPPRPEVGHLYSQGGAYVPVLVVHVSDKNVFFEYENTDLKCGSCSLELFSLHYKKVES